MIFQDFCLQKDALSSIVLRHNTYVHPSLALFVITLANRSMLQEAVPPYCGCACLVDMRIWDWKDIILMYDLIRRFPYATSLGNFAYRTWRHPASNSAQSEQKLIV